jgi:hypothetical protein
MPDLLIENYLRELRVSAWNWLLSPTETEDLEHEVRGSIDAALTAAGKRDEATVYRVLDRLGPAGDIVARHSAAPRSAVRRGIDGALAPLTGTRAILCERGWGAAEIVALLLLIVGPFYLWWLGPIFGIGLVRTVCSRWAHRVTHIATVVVVVLFSVQALTSLALVALVATGGLPGDGFQQVLSAFAPGAWVGGLAPLTVTAPGQGSLFPLDMIIVLPAPLAGVLSGAYLALSPRHRR